MAAARTARPARAHRRVPAPTARRIAGPRIRWERVGRIALLCVLALVLYLYIGPARNWVTTYGEAKDARAAVAALKDRNDALRGRQRELQRPSALEREARKLGMVRAGERAYVIEGLPRR